MCECIREFIKFLVLERFRTPVGFDQIGKCIIWFQCVMRSYEFDMRMLRFDMSQFVNCR